MVRIIYYIIFTILFTGFIIGCKPYDIDKANEDVIQGKWLLIDVDREKYNSVVIDYTKQKTYLIFDNNDCTEYMSDLNDTTEYKFSIKGYNLKLYRDTTLVNVLHISTLTKDSLIFNQKQDIWKYIKVKEAVK